jgi:hypothetical protein
MDKQVSTGGQSSSFLTCNQVDRHADFRCVRGHSGISAAVSKVGASACLPDVPRQYSENIDVALPVRECVRVLESGKDAN